MSNNSISYLQYRYYDKETPLESQQQDLLVTLLYTITITCETNTFLLEILYFHLATSISTVPKQRKKENETYVHYIYNVHILQEREGKGLEVFG